MAVAAVWHGVSLFGVDNIVVDFGAPLSLSSSAIQVWRFALLPSFIVCPLGALVTLVSPACGASDRSCWGGMGRPAWSLVGVARSTWWVGVVCLSFSFCPSLGLSWLMYYWCSMIESRTSSYCFCGEAALLLTGMFILQKLATSWIYELLKLSIVLIVSLQRVCGLSTATHLDYLLLFFFWRHSAFWLPYLWRLCYSGSVEETASLLCTVLVIAFPFGWTVWLTLLAVSPPCLDFYTSAPKCWLSHL